MKKVFHCLLLPCLFSLSTYSQTVEPSSTVGRLGIQTEFATNFSHVNNGNTTIRSWAPGTLIRYGLTKLVEIQVGFQAIQEELLEYNDPILSEVRFQNPELGLAIHLWKEKGFRPEAAVMSRVGISYDRPFSPFDLEGIFALNLSHTLIQNLFLSYNVGGFYAASSVASIFIVTNLSYEPVPRFHFFIENVTDHDRYGNLSASLAAGGGYNFSDSVVLDLSVGNNLHDSGLFAGAILTWSGRL